MYLNREVQPETGWLDLIHRGYDPTINRFLQVDPVVEGQEHLSPYQYGWNNPVLKSDPDGECPDCGDAAISVGIASAVASTMKDLAVSFANVALMQTPLRVKGGEKFTDFSFDYSRLNSDRSFTQALKDTGSDLLDVVNVASTVGTGGTAGAGMFFAKTGGKAVVTTAVTGRLKNAIAGEAREASELLDLQKMYPNASVQGQRYLRNKEGKIAKDAVTGEGRRVDFAVIQDKQAIDMVETTSLKAAKSTQVNKEARIRASGGTYIRDRNTKELIDVSNVPTRTSRRN